MKKGLFISTLLASSVLAWMAEAEVIQSPSYYRGRKLEMDLAGMPVLSLCEDDTAVSSWSIDKQEFQNEFLSFKKGICLVHRASKSRALSSEAESQSDANSRAIKHLDDAIQKGLPIAHQNYANVLEGVLHCRQAKILWPQYKQNLSFAVKSRFCSQRKNAIDTLSDIDFSALRLSFYNKKDVNIANFETLPSIATYTNEIGSCKNAKLLPDVAPLSPNGGLQGELDKLCDTERVSMEEASQIVNEVLSTKIVDRYIKGSTAPVTAMLQRKKDRASGVITNSQDEIASLQSSAKTTNKKYYCLNNQIYGKDKEWGANCFDLGLPFEDRIEVSQSIKKRADKVVEDYKTSVGNYAMVSETIDEYQNKLLVPTPEHPNPFDEIKQQNQKIDTKMEEYKTMFDIFRNNLETAINVKSSWKTDRKSQLAKLCRVYFCEILNEKNRDFRRQICEMDVGGGKRYSDTNPLCFGVQAQLTVDNSSRSVKDLCQSVSGDLFNNSYYVENRRGTDNTSDACWNDGTTNTESNVASGGSGSEPETFLSYYTDLLRWKKVYVLVVKDANNQITPYKMQSCTKDDALRVAQMKEVGSPEEGRSIIRDDYYYWDFVANGLYSNPYISCTPGEIDQDVIPTSQPVIFSNNAGIATYYLKATSGRFYSVDSKCDGIKEALGLKYPIRRFYNDEAPTSNVRSIQCGFEQIESSGVVADAGWKVYWVPPEDGWYIPSAETLSQDNDRCVLETGKAPQNHVGAFIFSHNDNTFLPVVKVNSCFLSNVTIYDHVIGGARTFPNRILSLRRFFGIPDEFIAKPLPKDLRSKVENFPFFEFCSNCSTSQTFQRFAARVSPAGVHELVNISASSQTTQINYLSGETAYKMNYAKPGSSTVNSVIFNSCNKKVLEALRLDYQPFERASTRQWYENLESDRKRKFQALEFPNTYPCFPRRSCTVAASSFEDIEKAMRDDVCNLAATAPLVPDYMEIQLKNDILIDQPIVWDGKTQIGDTQFTLNTFPQIRLVSVKPDGAPVKISFKLKDALNTPSGINGWILNYWKRTQWVDKYKSRYTSIPVLAFFSVKEVVLEKIEIDLVGNNGAILQQNRQPMADFVGIFAHNTRLLAKNIVTSKNFDKSMIARNFSEVYVSTSQLQASKTVANVQNSRLALYNTGVRNETESADQQQPRKGIHLTRNSELFVYGSEPGTVDNSIKAQVPIVIKGNNIDFVDNGVTKRNLQAKIYESVLVPYETDPNSVQQSECLWLRWGAKVYLEQTHFKCDIGVFFKDDPFINDINNYPAPDGRPYYTEADNVGYPSDHLTKGEVRYFEVQADGSRFNPSSASARYKALGAP
jgi:hypothetical protein